MPLTYAIDFFTKNHHFLAGIGKKYYLCSVFLPKLADNTMLFYEFGNKSNPTILLIHGLGIVWWQLQALYEPLSQNYHVIVPALDGHTLPFDNQPIPSCFTTLDSQAEQIEQFLLQHSISELHTVYGISLGGTIATRLSERAIISINRLIIDAGTIYNHLPAWAIKLSANFQTINCHLTIRLYKLYQKLFSSPYYRAFVEGVYLTFPVGGENTIRNAYTAVFSYTVRTLNTKQVEFWYGEKESWLQRPVSKHLLSIRPDAQIRVFPQMNHAQLLIDHPEEILKRISNSAAV